MFLNDLLWAVDTITVQTPIFVLLGNFSSSLDFCCGIEVLCDAKKSNLVNEIRRKMWVD